MRASRRASGTAPAYRGLGRRRKSGADNCAGTLFRAAGGPGRRRAARRLISFMLRRLGLASARRVEFDSGEQKFGIRVVESYKKNDFPPTREAASLPPCTPQRYGPVTRPELSTNAPGVGTVVIGCPLPLLDCRWQSVAVR
jgi:hypothetical protein